MSGTPLVRPGGQSQLEYGTGLPSQPTTTRTTPDSGLGADDQMRHQERRVPPPGFAHPPPPQYIPQDGGVMGPHHQSAPGVFGPCDGNFEKEKTSYEGPSPYNRGGFRYDMEPPMINEQMIFNRGQPMISGQNSIPRFDDSNSSRPPMHPPGPMPNHQGSVQPGGNYVGGYYGMGSGNGVAAVMQRPPIPTSYDADMVQQQQQLPHQMQPSMPHYYSPNQPPPNSVSYQQIQPGAAPGPYSGASAQQEQPQQPHQMMNPPSQAVMTMQQRGGQFIMPVPQVVAPQYVGQQVVPAGMHYPPAGVYVQSTVRPAVFVPRAEAGYAPIEPPQPVMVPMPFVVHHLPPNQPPEQGQPPYHHGVIEQQPAMSMEQYNETDFSTGVAPVQPVRPMSMPPGMPNVSQPVMGMMPQPAQQPLHESRSATSSIPPLMAPSGGYGPSPHPRMYGFPPTAMAPPFMMTPFGVPHVMHSSPNRGRNSRATASFRGNSSFQYKNKPNSSPQSFSRQSSVVETPKEESKPTEVVAAATAEVEGLSLKAEATNRLGSEAVQQEQQEEAKEIAAEDVEPVAKVEEEKTAPEEKSDTAPTLGVSANSELAVKSEVAREVAPTSTGKALTAQVCSEYFRGTFLKNSRVSATKAEFEKRSAVPVVAVAPVVSVKSETAQSRAKEHSEDEMPEKENLEMRIKDAPPLASVPPLPASEPVSPPVKLDCTFCRNLGMSEEVATSHVIRAEDGKVTCPELRKRSCSLCGATGDNAHSAFFCPLKSQQTMEEQDSELPRIASQRPPSSYNKPMNNERRGGYRGYGGTGHRGDGGGGARGGGYYHVS
ncbi:hypothetical protein Q1695_012446 [Nippostrongylus brasiliensis]|nr:hypothetical protein Q1695_012446 [Nippostrongylus brasiliensis]